MNRDTQTDIAPAAADPMRLLRYAIRVPLLLLHALITAPLALLVLNPVAARDFDPAVLAWLVHRPPAGRLARPINLFRECLDRELQALIRA